MNEVVQSGQFYLDFSDNDLLPIMLLIFAGIILIAVLFYPEIQANDRTKKRIMSIMSPVTTSTSQDLRSASELQKRRKAITESLQEVTSRNQRKKRLKLDVRMTQAGLSISPNLFMSLTVGLGICLGLIYFFMMGQPLVAAGIMITFIFGAPNWLLNYLRNKRIGKFITNFPPALETIVRGVRAGLPINDCFKVIAAEAQEPVKSEFRILVEALAFGLTLGEATERMAERIPTPETTFFSIVLAIQEKTGGNLGETLANLSNVLRDRKKLKEKIKALSTEATVSAGIIGSMPFIVMLAIHASTPGYLNVLFTTNQGKMILGGGLLWMVLGIIIMRQMINFDI